MKTNGGADTDAGSSVAAFVGRSAAYYERAFGRIHAARGFVWQFNPAAALFGPLWAGARGLWAYFGFALLADLLGLVTLARALPGNPGATEIARAARLQDAAAARAADAARALAGGDTASAETFGRIAGNLGNAAQEALARAQAQASGGSGLVVTGILILVLAHLVGGMLANAVYAQRYVAWRADRSIPAGLRTGNVLWSVALFVAIVPLTLYRFAAGSVPAWLVHVPVTNTVFEAAADSIDAALETLYRLGGRGFDGVRDLIRAIVHALEAGLVETPWPVVMGVIVLVAWRVAGRRVALFTCGAIGYLALMGLWSLAMQTVALLGAAAMICVGLGVPLGIWCARSARVYAVARPLLDLMQTMPSLVYLIPAIAFLGTGTPPGIIATIVFGMPPVVRLTALGLLSVPADLREAARAYGASDWQLLTGVELPLALPTIMTGVNQAILLCLSMVVVASLIGAQGLGSVVLEALQFGASGQGILAGIAILLCAIVIDRIAQATGNDTR
jgi:glycine betaine/proline transport system permease protein